MQAVADANSLRLLDADTSICPTIELRLYDGHTPGQIVPYIHTEDRTFVFAGDVIPLVGLRYVSDHVIQRETAHTC